jgi:phage baseplate assembly protein W
MLTFQTFKDLNITLKPHPVTGDLTVKKDEADIKQSITNLLLTSKGERFFNSQLGSGLSDLLFEPLDVGTASSINTEISTLITKYEPRVRITELSTLPNYEDNGFEVDLIVAIVGREDSPVSVQFFLERSR